MTIPVKPTPFTHGPVQQERKIAPTHSPAPRAAHPPPKPSGSGAGSLCITSFPSRREIRLEQAKTYVAQALKDHGLC